LLQQANTIRKSYKDHHCDNCFNYELEKKKSKERKNEKETKIEMNECRLGDVTRQLKESANEEDDQTP